MSRVIAIAVKAVAAAVPAEPDRGFKKKRFGLTKRLSVSPKQFESVRAAFFVCERFDGLMPENQGCTEGRLQ